MRLKRKRMIVALTATTALLGCSTQATITRVNGSEMSAKFAGSNRENVYVKTGREPLAIARKDIADIDHPGDTAAVIGGLLTGYGVYNIGVGAGKCETEGAAFCTGVFLPATVGASMLIWGIAVHGQSVRALKQNVELNHAAGVRMTPSVIASEQGALPGAVIEGRF